MTQSHKTETRNAEAERTELDAWAAQPDRAVGYVQHSPDQVLPRVVRITTWPGTVIATGVITGYSHGFGARLMHVNVLGTNSARYHGKGLGGGMIIRLRKCARQS